MLNIYEVKKLIPKDIKFINSCDAAFPKVVDSGCLNSDTIRRLVQVIDGSELINPEKIRTKYGDELSPVYLSTGCKAAILASLSGDKTCVNTIECGSNALLEILKLSNGCVLMPLYPTVDTNFDIDCRVFTRSVPEGTYCDNFFDFFYTMKEG